MFSTTTRRPAAELNASSMADIAFLLLVFFLVTTTIDIEKGISVKLPPFEPAPLVRQHERNVLSVKVNFEGELLVDGKPGAVTDLRQIVKTFILNPENDPSLAVSPQLAVISLQNDRSTSYRTYLTVYNELIGAYNELWEALALRQFGKSYQQLSEKQRRGIREAIPLVISEGELTDLQRNRFG
jgi:biopolymer transport protein ExbD